MRVTRLRANLYGLLPAVSHANPARLTTAAGLVHVAEVAASKATSGFFHGSFLTIALLNLTEAGSPLFERELWHR